MDNIFKPATKDKIKLKLAITGVSGSGKTYSALILARGIAGPGGKIAIADTENGSSVLYSHLTKFDVATMHPPFTVSKYIAAIDSAANNGYDIIILDTISQEWSGEGGILEQKSEVDERGGNQFTNWRRFTADHNKFLSTMLHCPIHLIACIRSKQDYVMTPDDKGKLAPRKVGLAPVQREGIEYEFSAVFDVDMAHRAQVTKDRTTLFGGRLFIITEAIGEEIAIWANAEVKNG